MLSPISSSKEESEDEDDSNDEEDDEEDELMKAQREEMYKILGGAYNLKEMEQTIQNKEDQKFFSLVDKLEGLLEKLELSTRECSHATVFLNDTIRRLGHELCSKMRTSAEYVEEPLRQFTKYDLADDLEDAIQNLVVPSDAFHKYYKRVMLTEKENFLNTPEKQTEVSNLRQSIKKGLDELSEVLDDINTDREKDIEIRDAQHTETPKSNSETTSSVEEKTEIPLNDSFDPTTLITINIPEEYPDVPSPDDPTVNILSPRPTISELTLDLNDLRFWTSDENNVDNKTVRPIIVYDMSSDDTVYQTVDEDVGVVCFIESDIPTDTGVMIPDVETVTTVNTGPDTYVVTTVVPETPIPRSRSRLSNVPDTYAAVVPETPIPRSRSRLSNVPDTYAAVVPEVPESLVSRSRSRLSNVVSTVVPETPITRSRSRLSNVPNTYAAAVTEVPEPTILRSRSSLTIREEAVNSIPSVLPFVSEVTDKTVNEKVPEPLPPSSADIEIHKELLTPRGQSLNLIHTLSMDPSAKNKIWGSWDTKLNRSSTSPKNKWTPHHNLMRSETRQRSREVSHMPLRDRTKNQTASASKNSENGVILNSIIQQVRDRALQKVEARRMQEGDRVRRKAEVEARKKAEQEARRQALEIAAKVRAEQEAKVRVDKEIERFGEEEWRKLHPDDPTPSKQKVWDYVTKGLVEDLKDSKLVMDGTLLEELAEEIHNNLLFYLGTEEAKKLLEKRTNPSQEFMTQVLAEAKQRQSGHLLKTSRSPQAEPGVPGPSGFNRRMAVPRLDLSSGSTSYTTGGRPRRDTLTNLDLSATATTREDSGRPIVDLPTPLSTAPNRTGGAFTRYSHHRRGVPILDLSEISHLPAIRSAREATWRRQHLEVSPTRTQKRRSAGPPDDRKDHSTTLTRRRTYRGPPLTAGGWGISHSTSGTTSVTSVVLPPDTEEPVETTLLEIARPTTTFDVRESSTTTSTSTLTTMETIVGESTTTTVVESGSISPLSSPSRNKSDVMDTPTRRRSVSAEETRQSPSKQSHNPFRRTLAGLTSQTMRVLAEISDDYVRDDQDIGYNITGVPDTIKRRKDDVPLDDKGFPVASLTATSSPSEFQCRGHSRRSGSEGHVGNPWRSLATQFSKTNRAIAMTLRREKGDRKRYTKDSGGEIQLESFWSGIKINSQAEGLILPKTTKDRLNKATSKPVSNTMLDTKKRKRQLPGPPDEVQNLGDPPPIDPATGIPPSGTATGHVSLPTHVSSLHVSIPPHVSSLYVSSPHVPSPHLPSLHVPSIQVNEENFFKSFTIEILKGENLMVPTVPEPIIGNPFVRIKVITGKGLKVKATKVKIKEINPEWTDERFTFHGLIFPVQCVCMSTKMIPNPLVRNTRIVEERRTSATNRLVGHFMIEKEHLNMDQPVQRWYFLETKDITPATQGGGKILVEIMATN